MYLAQWKPRKLFLVEEAAPAHDAYTHLLQRIPPDSQELWRETEQLVMKARGVLVIDDMTLDKPYAEKMARVSCHWSGKQHAVVMGINLISLLWTDARRMCLAISVSIILVRMV